MAHRRPRALPALAPKTDRLSERVYRSRVNADILARGLPGLLGPVWRLSPPYEIEPIVTRLKSLVVGLALPVASYMGKWVPEVNRAALHAGARASQIITRGGLSAGEPVLTRDGSITVDFAGGVVALMSYVSGVPLQSSPHDQPLLGKTLARAAADVGLAARRPGPGGVQAGPRDRSSRSYRLGRDDSRPTSMTSPRPSCISAEIQPLDHSCGSTPLRDCYPPTRWVLICRRCAATRGPSKPRTLRAGSPATTSPASQTRKRTGRAFTTHVTC